MPQARLTSPSPGAIVLNAARNNRVKVSVFSGAIFLPDDPVVMGALVPAAFWKIVAWKEDGALRARGYMQSQRELVERIVRSQRRRPESFEELGRMDPYEATVASIARITSLDFGPLMEADELGGLESRSGRRLTDEAVSSLARSLARATPGEDGPDDGRSAAQSDVGEIAALVKHMLRQNDNLVRLLERLGSAGSR